MTRDQIRRQIKHLYLLCFSFDQKTNSRARQTEVLLLTPKHRNSSTAISIVKTRSSFTFARSYHCRKMKYQIVFHTFLCLCSKVGLKILSDSRWDQPWQKLRDFQLVWWNLRDGTNERLCILSEHYTTVLSIRNSGICENDWFPAELVLENVKFFLG